MPATEATRKRSARTSSTVWTDEERAAAQAAVQERQAAAQHDGLDERAAGLQALREAIAKMPSDDRAMAERIHDVVTAAVPALISTTYYGMPAYATEGKAGKIGKAIAFFKPKSKFRVRYSTFGFQPDAKLDDGAMWPTEFAVIELTPAVERQIAELVKRAAG